MLSVSSARQLCKMFLSLHVVLLSVAFVDSSASNGNQKDCMRANGVEYRGEQQSSSSGLTCLNWSNSTRDYDVRIHPDSQTGVGDHNYCRNPDSSERPWCYIAGPDGTEQRQFCTVDTCKEHSSTVAAKAESLTPSATTPSTESFQPPKSRVSQGEAAAVRPAMGISQRVHTGPKKKKDLGTLGYVLGVLMMAVIIILGVGITFGYFYKRGRDLKKQHEQRVYEREMQRITLPLSAFSNPTCELVDENTIVITAEHETTPVLEEAEGGDPLMGQQADEADVKAVDAGFDHHNIPYDVIWLDIDHTDEKRYFTWDPVLFPRPTSLQRHLDKKKRKLVVINDPHIKVDPDWSLYSEARDGELFVKDREGQIYQGSCWPGKSSYLDFSSPACRAWYSRCFALDKYKGSTTSLFVWNDMNEPSVFNGPEQTMPKDAVHSGGWEHRELHNLYGFYQHMATVDGLITRSGGSERPFVLSRSFFAGSQRLGAIWTGDNVASWEYLKISIPMLLSLSVTGMVFCGADVGGFFLDPEPELLVRWYQAAALQPFFRGHSANVTKRREPWLFGEKVTAAIRAVIQQRYCLLPFWYTLFHQAHTSALPPLRPLWVEFPQEQSIFTVDNQYMIGGALLACPITESGVQEVKVLLPGSDEIWYDVHSGKAYKGGRTLSLPVTLDTVPVFQRGGSVVCRSVGSCSCTAELQQLPLSITVALNSQGVADGELYLDDGHSFNYRDKKAFCLRRFNMLSNHLICRPASEEGTFDCDSVMQSVTILGVKSKPTTVVVHVSGAKDASVAFQYMETCCRLTVSNLNLKVTKDWEIKMDEL